MGQNIRLVALAEIRLMAVDAEVKSVGISSLTGESRKGFNRQGYQGSEKKLRISDYYEEA
jgi:hypothetical protein